MFFFVVMAFDGGDCKLIAAWAEEKSGVSVVKVADAALLGNSIAPWGLVLG